ncbi:cyclase [Microcoleus sp. FACHB-1515]|uniref:SRPBCC family protein n=1 Tax=Cyanophyceae TaxID=3028117 RepID=UPI001681DFE3|nr:SRPBCC family protein [Microcoleus sp. FACHB-1515]MBD2091638.1 cyclase [Microcoleus sp. FACHB-1515]
MVSAIDRPTSDNLAALRSGEVQIQTRAHSAWGGAVTAQLFLPIDRASAWQQVTNYPRWVEYFPDIVRSDVLGSISQGKRLYQVGRKAVLMFAAEVEIVLRAIDSTTADQQQILFQLERGSFRDFSAQLRLQDFHTGTLLTYSVQATPAIPVPSLLIQEGMKLDLPANLRSMRHVLCNR